MNEKVKNTDENNPEFAIQRLYIKDLSYEAPSVPEVFNTEWEPDVNLDLNITTTSLGEDMYEVVLKVTSTVKLPKQTAFLVEVDQAGIFLVKNFPEEQLQAMLGSFCPNILFPYVREVVSDVVVKGGFPPLYLAPINFDGLYQQQMEGGKDDEKGRIIH